MAERLLEFILTRLDEAQDPIVRYRELERFTTSERQRLLAAGILKQRPEATEVTGPWGTTLLVRRTSRGLLGVPKEDDEYSESVRLTEDDIREYSVSIPKLADALRKANGISGTGCVYEDGLLSLGQKAVEDVGSVDVYLSFPNLDETCLRSRCHRLVRSPGAQKVILLTPRGISVSAEVRQMLDSTGVVIASLMPGSRESLLHLNWKEIMGQGGGALDGVFLPNLVRLQGKECDTLSPTEIRIVQFLFDENIKQIKDRVPIRDLVKHAWQGVDADKHAVSSMLDRIRTKLKADGISFQFGLRGQHIVKK